MGLFFRKRLARFGPLSVNLSRSGIGISAGVRGLRAGITSHRGVYTSAGLPGTGLRYVRYYRHHHGAEPPAHAAAFAIGFLLPFVILIAIALRSVMDHGTTTTLSLWRAETLIIRNLYGEIPHGR
jgi:Protein of unknown function (DUF4236)